MHPVSILITCQNNAETIAYAIETAIAQGASEIILADNGSTDGSVEIAQGYPEVDVHSSEEVVTRGVLRNFLLGLAEQNWILYLDGGNAFLPYALDVFMDSLESGVDVLYANYFVNRLGYQLDPFLIKPLDPIRGLLLSERLIHANAMLIRRNRLTMNPWNETFDSNLTERLLLAGLVAGYNFVGVDFNALTFNFPQASTADIQNNLSFRQGFALDLLAYLDAEHPGEYATEREVSARRLALELSITPLFTPP